MPGKTFFWAGVYSADMNDRTTLRTDLNVFADFQPKLPDSYRSAPYLLLGNIQPELQRSVRAQMNGVRLAGGDTMNYWIKDFREELLATIRDWDFLLINDSEARMLSGRVQPAPRRAEDPRNGSAHAGDQARRVRRHPVPPRLPFHGARLSAGDVFDPTGAGDCFAGGFIGYLAGQGIEPRDRAIDLAELRRAVIYGSVMGSFCCERFGVDRFRDLTRAEIDRRYEEFKTCTAF